MGPEDINLLTFFLFKVAFNCSILFLGFYGQQDFSNVSTMLIGLVPIRPTRYPDDIIAPRSTNTLSPRTYFKWIDSYN